MSLRGTTRHFISDLWLADRSTRDTGKRRIFGGGGGGGEHLFSALRTLEGTTRPRKRKAVSPAAFRRNAERLPSELQEAEDALLKCALQLARDLSKGPFKSAQLAQMGHPYRHGGRPPADPAIINRQSGRFLRSWAIHKTGGLMGRLVNRAPYARYLFAGTDRMIARPIMERVRAFLQAAAAPKVAATICDTLNRS